MIAYGIKNKEGEYLTLSISQEPEFIDDIKWVALWEKVTDITGPSGFPHWSIDMGWEIIPITIRDATKIDKELEK